MGITSNKPGGLEIRNTILLWFSLAGESIRPEGFKLEVITYKLAKRCLTSIAESVISDPKPARVAECKFFGKISNPKIHKRFI